MMSASIEEKHSGDTEIMPLIKATKKALARKYIAFLNADFVNNVRTLNFPIPKRLDGKPSSRFSSDSTSSSADMESPEKNIEKKGIKISYSSKVVNRINEFLLQFEDRCFIGHIISECQIRTLRSLNRGILGKVIENFNIFKHQRSLPIAINILMFNSSKMRIPKEIFKDLISELFPDAFECNLGSSIQSLKKSKTYEFLKTIIRS